jgi:hypothetical protein
MTALRASQVPEVGEPSAPHPNLRSRLTVAAGLLLFSAGAALAGAAIGAQAEATAYQSARQCPPDARVAGPNCFALEPATLRAVNIRHGKSSNSAVVDLAITGGQSRQATINPVDGVEGQLEPGNSVIAREYRGHITAVEVGGYAIGTEADNPIVQARLIVLAAVVLAGLGLVLLTGLVAKLSMLSPTSPTGSIQPMRQPAEQTPTLPLVLRPDSKNAKGHAVGLGTLAFAGLLVVMRLGNWAPLGLVVLGVGLFAYVTFLWLYLRNADIFVDELNVGKRGLFGQTRTFDRTAIRKVVLTMQQSTTRYGTTQIRRLFLVGQDGRAWLRINGAYWSAVDVELLARALRVPVEGSWNEPADLAAVRREIPGSFSWMEAHPTAAGLILAPLILAVMAAAFLAAGALQGQSS